MQIRSTSRSEPVGNAERSRFPRGAAVFATVFLALAASSCGGPSKDLRPIVLITIDTIRADHLGVYGYFRDTSPALDRFANDAVVFDHVIAPIATTLPAHVSVMTSTNPITHGINSNFHPGLDEETSPLTFAEILSDLGYTTAGFVSATPLKDHTGIQFGFDTFDQPEGNQRRAGETIDRVLDWLETVGEEPYFLWVHLFDPHAPYDPPEPFDRRYATDDTLIDLLRNRGLSAYEDSKIQELHNRYDGEIRYMDDQIGRMFSALDQRGDLGRGAIVVTGDHGEGLGQHDWLRHGQIFNEQLFVPLILKLPGSNQAGGSRHSTLASPLDIVPTVARALALPISDEIFAEFEGIDLFGIPAAREHLLSERAPRETANTFGDANLPPERHRVAGRAQRPWEPGLKYALTGIAWKYVHLTEGEDELFDLQADPIEMHNVLHLHPEVAEAMRVGLLEVIEDGLDRRAEREDGELPQEVLDQLEDLGYVR